MNSIKGKSAIIFGGNGGISRAINQALLTNGIKNLLLVDIKEDSSYVAELKDQFKDSKVFFELCDITNKESIAGIFKTYFKLFGYIDILVNSAGIVGEHNIELSYKINVLGPIYTCLEAVNFMGKHNGGSGGVIINLASVAGLNPYGVYPIYASTKHALVGFSRSLMEPDFSDMSGVKVICLCPGATETPMLRNLDEKATRFPGLEKLATVHLSMQEIQSPKTVAEAMLMALNDESHGVWMATNGTCKKINMSRYEY